MHVATTERFTKKELLFTNCFKSDFQRQVAENTFWAMSVPSSWDAAAWGNSAGDTCRPLTGVFGHSHHRLATLAATQEGGCPLEEADKLGWHISAPHLYPPTPDLALHHRSDCHFWAKVTGRKVCPLYSGSFPSRQLSINRSHTPGEGGATEGKNLDQNRFHTLSEQEVNFNLLNH